MNSLKPYCRPNWKPRIRFPQPGKPRSNRGISQRKKRIASLSCLKTRVNNSAKNQRNTAAAGFQPKSGRRLNRLPEWTDPKSYITKGGRHRLFGEDYQRLRRSAFERACGRCECKKCATLPVRRPALWGDTFNFLRGDFAHNEHGSRKSDELHRGKWKNRVCHMNEHNCGGKPCPKKEKAA